MKTILSILSAAILIGYTAPTKAQTGTLSDPFTTLDQAANVTTAGFYYFNLSGNTFDSYVNENGYVQVAIDFGNGAGALPTGTSLDTLSRGILDATTLLSLNGIQEVRVSSSTGNTDVVTSHDSIIWRVQNNMCLHRGWIDTAINQNWVGLNDTAFTTHPTVFCGPASGTNSLAERIVHICGAYDSFTWFPLYGYQRDVWDNGEVLANEKFQLWVKGNQCTGPVNTTDVISSCSPITWIDGNTYSSSNNTATHTLTTVEGCDSIITLDLTINTADASVSQNGFILSADISGQSYQWIDCDNNNTAINGETAQTFEPTANGSYALITTVGNCSDTSACYTIVGLSYDDLSSPVVKIYPNPTQDYLFIETQEEILYLTITTVNGQIVDISKQFSYAQIDLRNLPTGFYFLHIETSSGILRTRFLKE